MNLAKHLMDVYLILFSGTLKHHEAQSFDFTPKFMTVLNTIIICLLRCNQCARIELNFHLPRPQSANLSPSTQSSTSLSIDYLSSASAAFIQLSARTQGTEGSAMGTKALDSWWAGVTSVTRAAPAASPRDVTGEREKVKMRRNMCL